MNSTDEEIYDITIIGGGPAGLFAGFYAGMRQVKVKIIESLPQLGGQLAALYPEKNIYDIAGFPNITAQDLVNNLEKQLNMFSPTVVLNQAVEKLERIEDDILKLSSKEGTHYTKTVIITAGNGAFAPRKLKIDGCSKYEDINIHYQVNNMEQYKNKNVMLLGGGDSAVDWAMMLEPIAKQVTLVHRRNEFRAHEQSVQMLRNSSVEVLTPFEPKEIIGLNEAETVLLKEVKGDQEIKREIDYILCNYGFISQLGSIKDWGLEIEKNSIVVNTKMETKIPGVYAAGDITTYPGKVKLIAVGFGEGPTAVNNAKAYIDPTARLQPKHSTAMDFSNVGV